jgi:uncharacterized membrane protein YphA (DoxX/SURF4 family)
LIDWKGMQFRDLLDAVIPAAQAHEKWFVSSPAAYAQPLFFRTFNPWTVTALAVVIVALVVGFILDPKYERTDLYARIETKLRPLRDYAAGVLAVAMAVLCLFNAWRGTLLATNVPLAGHGLFGASLRAAEVTVGFMLLVGLYTPAAGIGIVLLYLATFAVNGTAAPLELLNIAGIGIFLYYFSRGRWSLDWFLGKPIFSTSDQRKSAYLVLRTTLGIAFLILAVWNKWLDPGYHLSLMDKYRTFNPYVLVENSGLLSLSREQYVFILLCVELTVGLFEVLGLFTRAAAVLLIPIFCASVVFLPPAELVGHLPILATLFVLIVYGDTYHKGRARGKLDSPPVA